MNSILPFIFLSIIFLSSPISSLFSSKSILCNQSISLSSINLLLPKTENQLLTICNITFNISLYPNEYFFSQNISIDKSIKFQPKRHFLYHGQILNEKYSSISLIIYPQLQIFIYLNNTYYYYLSLKKQNSSILLKFSQQELLQYYPQLVNDSLWNNLQQEENLYQKTSLILHDLHFIYEFLTIRCESKNIQYKTISFCSLALLIDKYLYEKTFNSNIYYLYIIIEHFNFLLRTLTKHEYGGFLIKNLTLIEHININSNSSFELLHTLSNDNNLSLKNYCLIHQMFSTNNEYDNFILGYQSSSQTYDIGGICSTPFYLNNNYSAEINLNTGLSMLNENLTQNLSIFFNGLMKTSYLFLRQMGLNLTLCSINSTRRSFFQFNTQFSPIIQHCIDLIPLTLYPALKRRSHLCFNHLNLLNQSIKQDITCQQSIDLQSLVQIDGKHRKSLYIENALNNNRRSEWFEGNIVGMILTLSLIIWIPVSCFVHFFVDEINKKSLIEKQQQQHEMEILTTKLPIGITKQTQTE